jgi:flagellar biosynthesis protein FliR
MELSSADVSFAQIGREVVIGVVLGASLGIPGIAAYFVGSWVSLELWGRRREAWEMLGSLSPLAVTDLFVCLFAVLFLGSGLLEKLIFAVAESFSYFSLTEQDGTAGLGQLVAQSGQLAFRSAYLLALPIFFALLVVDASAAVAVRYARFIFDGDIVQGVRLSAMLFLLLLLLPFIVLGLRVQNTIGVDAVQSLLRESAAHAGPAAGGK